MKLPEQIKVGPFRYAVVGDKHAMTAKQAEFKDGRIGNADHERLILTVDPELPPDLLAECVLHETLHALMSTVGAADVKMTDEQFIHHTSPMLLAVLRENPALVAFLLAES